MPDPRTESLRIAAAHRRSEANRKFVRHLQTCPKCRAWPVTGCREGVRLWKEWKAGCVNAGG